jgi:hypothetical protein
MRFIRSLSLLAILLLSACASIAPSGTSGPSLPPASVSAPSSSLGTTATPSTSSEAPSSLVATPIELSSETPPEATRTPKPPKTPKPTPTRSPTTPPTLVDLEMFVYGADLPSPWYTNTTYVLPIHITVTGAPIPNAHAKVTIENITAEWETGPIAPADTYAYNLSLTLTAAGPTEFTTSIKTPPGFTDTDRSNNKGSFPLEITAKP